MEAVWERFLTQRDRAVYEQAGFGRHAGLKDRPALLVIDFSHHFIGDRPEPILDAVQRFKSSCGEEGWRAKERLVPVLAAARNKGIPVMYSTSGEDHLLLSRHSWGAKTKRLGVANADPMPNSHAIPKDIAPLPHEPLFRKEKPSVFFGTALLQYLINLGVNQLLLCGTTTSGCVRATAVDAFSYNYRVAVIEDCTFDRGQASHGISLFDMSQKYADIISSRQAIDYVNQLPEGLFPDWNPRGAEGSVG